MAQPKDVVHEAKEQFSRRVIIKLGMQDDDLNSISSQHQRPIENSARSIKSSQVLKQLEGEDEEGVLIIPRQFRKLQPPPIQLLEKPTLSANVLQQLLTMSPIEMQRHLSSKTFKAQLDGTKPENSIPLLVMKLIERIIKEWDQKSEKIVLLSLFLESSFAEDLRTYIEACCVELTSLVEFTEQQDFVAKSIEVYSLLLDMFPSKREAIPGISLAFSAGELDRSMISRQNKLQREKSEKLKEQSTKFMAKFMGQVQNQENIEESKKSQRSFIQYKFADDESYKTLPTDDFSKIDVIPGQDQLTVKSNRLRRMPETGNLINHHNYLDLLFRLLQEDMLRDLRESVEEMRKLSHTFGNRLTKKDIMKVAGEKSISLMQEVRMMTVEAVEGVGCVSFKIQTEKGRQIDWESSDLFKSGSLVLLSTNHFEKFFVGILRNRDGEKMNKTHKKNGFVLLNIELMGTVSFKLKSWNLLDIIDTYRSQTLEMIESPAYFEGYVHVLRSLQRMSKWQGLPFQQRIVEGKPKLYYPSYVDSSQMDHLLNKFLRNLQLDDSQQQALEKALTSDIALIQGPPGTGKTYIGVQIVRFLLKNRELWQNRGPILIVTYTNHALGQFLTHVAQYTDKIVKVGGKPVEDDKFEAFSFRKLLQGRGSKKDYWDARQGLNQASSRISYFEKMYKALDYGYINHNNSSGRSKVDLIITELQREFIVELKSILQEESEEFAQFARYKVEELRRLTGDSILFIFWLGIIDLEKYVHSLDWSEYDSKKIEDFLQGKRVPMIQDVDLNHQAIVNSFSTSTCSDYLSGKGRKPQIQTFGEAINLISTNNGYQMTQSEVNSAINFQTRTSSLQELPMNQRWAINNFLLSEMRQAVKPIMEKVINAYSAAQNELERMDIKNSRAIFAEADIVVMTTTGRSKYSKYFTKVTFPIVIVEEAAEVLEAHIITALSQETEHLILIGDHQQLKPNPQVYELSLDYNLSLSMFERLINNKVPHSTLTLQRRMRPEITSMMNLIYPKLRNHDSVRRFPQIYGVGSSLYFYDHRFMEQSTNDRTKLNKEEAEIIVRFAVYLMENKYSPDNITILTLYSGQLLHIKQIIKNYKMLQEELQKIQVVNVDNYQGEENDIVLLSLVRSNPQNKIGFLNIPNRVCVALSRARMGLYIFGNSKCLLASNLRLWVDVISYLKENQFFGETLQLQCSHKKSQVRIVQDFNRVKCKAICLKKMPCGHSCQNDCHRVITSNGDPTGHKDQICLQPCLLPVACIHLCKRTCYDCRRGHTPCEIQMTRPMPKCGHKVQAMCSQDLLKCTCPYQCERKLTCGHDCKLKCYQICDIKLCVEQVNKKLQCGHFLDMLCNERPELKQCKRPCQRILKCGHQCKLTCWQACTSMYCITEVKKQLSCGHVLGMYCYENPVSKQCKVACERKLQCGHRCLQACYQQCYTRACTEQVQKQLRCGHQMQMACCENPDNKLCQQPCKGVLPCGHNCSGICGQCKVKRSHNKCTVRCSKTLLCGHRCQHFCSQPCPPCKEKCAKTCPHGECANLCGVQCLCSSGCENSCKHTECTRQCLEPCDRKPCNIKCQKRLQCGHACLGLCGEDCLTVCSQCEPTHIGFEGILNVGSTALIQIECGHIFEVGVLDKHMAEPQTLIKHKGCPKCNQPIIKVKRYMRYSNQTISALNDAKMIIQTLSQELTSNVWHKCMNDHFFTVAEDDQSIFKICTRCMEDTKKQNFKQLVYRGLMSTFSQFGYI